MLSDIQSELKISIVIPAYNAGKWITETLSSVDAERWDEVETIVVDDGSTDNTADIVAADFPWVRLERQSNQGCSAARTRGTELGIGKYVKYLDADDLLVPGVLIRQLAIAESSNADVVYGNWQKLVQKADRSWEVGQETCRRIEDVSDDEELAFFTHMWCTTGAYLWRTSFVKNRHPGWHPRLPVIQDARFALDAAIANAKFVYDAQIAATYRVQNAGSVSTTSSLRFNRDCFLNCQEIYLHWASNSKLTEARANAVLELCENFGLWTYPLDSHLAMSMFEFAKTVKPGWRPCLSMMRRMTSRALGVRRMAYIHGMLHKLRKFVHLSDSNP